VLFAPRKRLFALFENGVATLWKAARHPNAILPGKPGAPLLQQMQGIRRKAVGLRRAVD